MNKQTAVEWFVEELFKKIDYTQVDPKIIEQALAMEREQLKEMYLKGIENYDPTFKRKGGEQ
jgi:hypothetical protein